MKRKYLKHDLEKCELYSYLHIILALYDMKAANDNCRKVSYPSFLSAESSVDTHATKIWIKCMCGLKLCRK